MTPLWIVLLDTSGSMRRQFSDAAQFAGVVDVSEASNKLDAAKEALERQLHSLANCNVALVAFTDEEPSVLAEGSPASILAARPFANLHAGGGTDIAWALRFADEYAADRARITTILVISDGLSEIEPATAAAQRAFERGSRISTILIDQTPDGEELARSISLGGDVRVVASPAQLREAVERSAATALRAPDRLLREFSDRLDRLERLERYFAPVLAPGLEFQRERESRAPDMETALRMLDADFRDFVWRMAVGNDPNAIAMSRYVPVRIYVADPLPTADELDRLREVIIAVGQRFGFIVATELPAEQGSWWKRFFLRTHQAATHEEVTSRLAKIEEGLEATYLNKPQSEANKNQAEAVASLISALKDIPLGCIQVGTLLLVKAIGPNGAPCVAARTLTSQELKRLEQNQSMLEKPNEILMWLSREQPEA